MNGVRVAVPPGSSAGAGAVSAANNLHPSAHAAAATRIPARATLPRRGWPGGCAVIRL
ncbi:MAG: hypothetical protein JW929_03875 [Anaerolineales bacterium]|nr:hypothetical protein [Anaerolineales bacterium]